MTWKQVISTAKTASRHRGAHVVLVAVHSLFIEPLTAHLSILAEADGDPAEAVQAEDDVDALWPTRWRERVEVGFEPTDEVGWDRYQEAVAELR